MITVEELQAAVRAAGELRDAVRESGPAGRPARSTVEEALGRHEAVVVRLRRAIDGAAGVGPWTRVLPAEQAACGRAGHPAGCQEADTSVWHAPEVPGEAWPAARRALLDVARRNGFERVEVLADRPGDRSLRIHGPEGAALNLVAGRRTVLSIRSGCHPAATSTRPAAP